MDAAAPKQRQTKTKKILRTSSQIYKEVSREKNAAHSTQTNLDTLNLPTLEDPWLVALRDALHTIPVMELAVVQMDVGLCNQIIEIL